MNIKTKYDTGDKVWFYEAGKVYQAKVIHTKVDANGGTKISYELDRKDREYKEYWNFISTRFGLDNPIPSSSFYEDDLALTKEDLKKTLKARENKRHNIQIERINDL